MKYSIYFLLAIISFTSFGQSVYQPLDKSNYSKLDRLEINQGELNQNFHSGVKPFKRQEIVKSINPNDSTLSKVDEFNINYFLLDNNEWSAIDSASNKPFLKGLYRNKSDLFHHNEKDFDLHLNPVINLNIGNDSESDSYTYINTRGVELRGNIDNKIGFYTYLTDNQIIFPSYVNKRIIHRSAVPGENFWKSYSDGQGVDFFTARGYITWNFTKHISAQFGHDKNFIGDGYRSLILSDYGGNYTFLKFSTNVWKLNYTNIFAELTANTLQNVNNTPGDGVFPKKYMAFHHLSANIGKKLNIGVFESIVYGGQDSITSAKFEISYLNPIIFYRSIEQNLGSDGNAMLGLNFKWLALNKVQLYGQFVLDEFNIDKLREDKTWWANKYGIQLGIKYIDAFTVNNLDLLFETNIVRPYTYTHNSQASYSSYEQELAHPHGANFFEYVATAIYQPLPRLTCTGKIIYTDLGKDIFNSNYGQDILLKNSTRNSEFGNTIGQGISTQIMYLNLTLSYMLKHNFFIDFQATLRQETSALNNLSYSNQYFSGGIRWNISQRHMDY